MACILVGCGDNEPDIVGPFTGETRRFVVDSITIPRTDRDAYVIADDLGGGDFDDGKQLSDNQLGHAIAVLADFGDITTNGQDMIASGSIASYVEISANDFQNDRKVGVTYFGAAGEPATVVGGSLLDGVFLSNRTRTSRVPGSAVAYLPVFIDADPIAVPLIGVEIDLEADGQGGFDGVIRGAVLGDEVAAVAYPGVAQMLKNDPTAHYTMFGLWDAEPKDWFVTYEEFKNNPLTYSLISPDIKVLGRPATSLAFSVHVTPCETGRCSTTPPADTCHDRIKDGSESDVDCGGDCRGCIEGVMCTVGSDCESRACDDGRCRAPSCTDNVRDGFESDVDCGRFCPPCGSGQRCWNNGDCHSSSMCVAPCSMTYCEPEFGKCL